ncbi:hypothetical protein [Halorussus pelagicus]|uniref:hypothetical protein n=1 Tax=Halorussus pelagicus TaxID=2505977 RepID=UPI000FFB5481|nr:hypothetical protein [Halorussus pelagicus]
MTDSAWELYTEDNVLVARFPEGMPADESEFAKVNEQFEELAAKEDVTAHISFVQMDDALHEGVYEKAAEAARVGKTYGITKWAMVSEGIKKMAVASSINEIEGVETTTTSSFEDAMEWAKE